MLRQCAAPISAFLVGFACQLPFFDRWFSFMDEGHLLLYADLIANGGELYRDATVYPLPGAFWLLAAAFHVFGPSNLLARWILLVEFSVVLALVFSLFRRMAGPRLAWTAVAAMLVYRVWAFPHWHMYSYSSTALLLQLAALWAGLRFFDSGHRAALAAAGLLFGLGVLCKQDYGAAALVAFAATAAVWARTAPEPRPRLAPVAAAFLGPAALVGVAAGIHFWRAGILGEVVRFTALNHFAGMSRFEYSGFPDLLPLFAQDPALRSIDGLTAYMPAIVYVADWKLLYGSRLFHETWLYDLAMKLYYFAPYPIVAFGWLRLVRRRAELLDPATRRARLAELGLFAFGAALMVWVRINRPQDYVHLAVLYWPMLLLPLLWTADGLRRLRAGRPRLAAAALVLLLAPAVAAAAYSARLAWRLRALHDTPIPGGERGGIRVTKNEAALLRDALDWLRARSAPGETVAILPYFPILHFLAERPGPDRSAYIVWPFPELPDRDRRIIASFEAKRPELLVYAFNRLGGFPDVRAFAPELYAYLVENYEIERIFSTDYLGYKLAGARRLRDVEAGRPLGAELAAGALLVASDEAPPRAIPPAERASFVARDLWPFRPVLALRPSAEGARTRLALPLDVPEGARLRTAVGVHPEAWYGYPASWVRFEIAVLAAGQRTLLFERTLRTTSNLADRGWFEVDVPIDRWSSRSVTLELSTAAENATGVSLAHGGFAEPLLLVARPPSDLLARRP